MSTRELRRAPRHSHRLFYADELSRLGHSVYRAPEPNYLRRLLRHRLAWLIWTALHSYTGERRRAHCIFAGQEDAAIVLLALRRAPVLRRPVIVTNVALLKPKNVTGSRRAVWIRLLAGADAVVSYSSAQSTELGNRFQSRQRGLVARVVLPPAQC